MISYEVGEPIVHTDQFSDWLKEHGIDPGSCFRVDVYPGTKRVEFGLYVRCLGKVVVNMTTGDAETITFRTRLKSEPPQKAQAHKLGRYVGKA